MDHTAAHKHSGTALLYDIYDNTSPRVRVVRVRYSNRYSYDRGIRPPRTRTAAPAGRPPGPLQYLVAGRYSSRYGTVRITRTVLFLQDLEESVVCTNMIAIILTSTGCPRTSKKVVRSEVFRKQASTFLIFYSSKVIRDVSGILSDLGKSKRQGSLLYLLSWK